MTIDGEPGLDWARSVTAKLSAIDEVRLLRRTTVFGAYDGNYHAALERFGDGGVKSESGRVRQRLWHIRAAYVILATGAHERSLVFANNDRPGVMLASAVQAYINRWGVVPGQRMVLFTNNDRAYECALDANDAGIEVVAVVDCRNEPRGPLVRSARERGIEILAGHVVIDSGGRAALRHGRDV